MCILAQPDDESLGTGCTLARYCTEGIETYLVTVISLKSVIKTWKTCDFLLGNPHEMPLNGFVEALQKSVSPRDKDWYAYKMNEPEFIPMGKFC
jgi:hypothetical protein